MNCESKNEELTEEERRKIIQVLEKYGNGKLNILNTLLEIQKVSDNRYIGESACQIISEKIGIPLIELYGILTFYSMLETSVQAKYKIEVCNSASCYINNSESVIEFLERKLGIKVGEKTADGLFSLNTCACFGACDIAPAMKIGENVYGNLDEAKVESILNDLKQGEKV